MVTAYSQVIHPTSYHQLNIRSYAGLLPIYNESAEDLGESDEDEPQQRILRQRRLAAQPVGERALRLRRPVVRLAVRLRRLHEHYLMDKRSNCYLCCIL